MHSKNLLSLHLFSNILVIPYYPSIAYDNQIPCGVAVNPADGQKWQLDFETKLARRNTGKTIQRRAPSEKVIPVYFHIISKASSQNESDGYITSVFHNSTKLF
jgi:hypothetical protein